MAGRLVALTLAALVIVAASALLGPTWPRWDEVTAPWRGDRSRDALNAFWELRVPRTMLAGLTGAGLAIGGVVFQALFRNPLAEPYTLGIASGASLGAAIGFLTRLSGSIGWLPVRTILAFAGAVVAMSLVYLMARLRRGQDMTRLLLAGVCVAYTSAAGVLLVTFLAEQAVTNEVVVWLMGSLDVFRPAALVEIGAILLVVLAFGVYAHRGLDLLWFGEHLAAARGVAVGWTVWGSFALTGVLTATIVANCGPIGFVGLMVPHMARAVLGVRTLPLLWGAATIGAAFLALCDGLGRALLSMIHQRPVGYEIPVGVITNILGAGFFFYLLATRDVARDAAL